MATWTVKITVANLQAKHVDVVATREDGAEILDFSLGRFSVDTHDKPLPDIRADAVATLWAQFQEHLAEATQIATMLAGWEAALATDLNALET